MRGVARMLWARGGAGRRFVAALPLLASLGCTRRPSAQLTGECRALGEGKTENATVRILRGSVVAEGKVRKAGRPRDCADSKKASTAFCSANAALSAAPAWLRPSGRLDVHLAASNGGAASAPVEVLRGDGALLLRATGPATPDVWMHELVHVRMHPRLPNGLAARRTARALEEGIADYVAAVAVDSPSVGATKERRRLDLPAFGAAERWAQLAIAKRFDPHPLGLLLARRLYGALKLSAPHARSMLRAGRQVTWENASTPGAVASAFVAVCTASDCPAVRAVLFAWLPEELRDSAP